MVVKLDLWVIYDHPLDFPDHYVVRRQTVVQGQGMNLELGEPLLADSLGEARLLVPAGLVCLSRQREDDPTIVETWL